MNAVALLMPRAARTTDFDSCILILNRCLLIGVDLEDGVGLKDSNISDACVDPVE